MSIGQTEGEDKLREMREGHCPPSRILGLEPRLGVYHGATVASYTSFDWKIIQESQAEKNHQNIPLRSRDIEECLGAGSAKTPTPWDFSGRVTKSLGIPRVNTHHIPFNLRLMKKAIVASYLG
jgi:hypothetical protein